MRLQNAAVGLVPEWVVAPSGMLSVLREVSRIDFRSEQVAQLTEAKRTRTEGPEGYFEH